MHCLNRTCPAFTYPIQRWLTRRHSCTQLFVGGLSFDTNESVLKDAFEEFGEIVEVKVICDRVSGKSRGYGFVNYSSEEAASKALKEMDGRFLDGRNIRIHNAYRGGRQGNQFAGTPADLYGIMSLNIKFVNVIWERIKENNELLRNYGLVRQG